MFVLSALYMALVGACISVPLENPSLDPASPMLIEPEPSSGMQPADQPEPINEYEPVPYLEESNKELAPSSDDLKYFDSRIVGGSDAPITKYMVALVVGWQVKSFICGASLISPQIMLSAAHCIMIDWITGDLMKSFHGIVGTNTWNQGGVVVKIESHLIHPKYNFAIIKNDIAVIKTKKEVQLSQNVQPIRLDFNWVGSGVSVYATGWGAQETWGGAAKKLQILFLQTISEEECLKLINDVIGHGSSVPIDKRIEIFTFHSVGHGMCFGDSGSALVSIKNKLQVGIVSWGFPCANGGPDVYVRVSAMEWFIRNAIKQLLYN